MSSVSFTRSTLASLRIGCARELLDAAQPPSTRTPPTRNVPKRRGKGAVDRIMCWPSEGVAQHELHLSGRAAPGGTRVQHVGDATEARGRRDVRVRRRKKVR